MARRISVHTESGNTDEKVVIDWSVFDSLSMERNVVGGFTRQDIMAKYGWSETTTRRNLDKLIKDGKIGFIGYRGQNKVYDTLNKK